MPEDLTPAERSQRARQAAFTSWGNTRDPAARTKPARDALLARFEPDDPNGELTAEQRRRMAEANKKAYFANLALKSAVARRKGKAALAALEAASGIEQQQDREVA